MARHILALIVVAFGTALPATAAEKVALREQPTAGDTAVVTLAFEVNGDIGDEEAGAKFTGRGRFGFEEKIVPPRSEAAGGARALRYYNASAVESTVGEERSSRELREPVRLLIGELRGGKPFLFSPSGPLTWEEQQLVEGPLDSLTVGGLLPTDAVTMGDEWKPGDGTIAAVFNLAAVTKNEVSCKLDSADDKVARIGIRGDVEGVVLGAQSKLSVTGQIVFDRSLGKITQVHVKQTERHEAGPIEPGFKVDASFTFERKIGAPLARLGTRDIEKLPLAPNPATEQLVYEQPDGRFRFYFPRGWHVFKSNPQMVILRLIEGGEWIAQCNVTAAPTVAAGTHMKPEEFRTQVQQALGQQFDKFIQEGEVPAPEGHWLYRLAAVGGAGKEVVVWYYHLAASPQGQQLVFIFTLASRFVDQFAAKDLAVVGTLEFGPVRTASSKKEP